MIEGYVARPTGLWNENWGGLESVFYRVSRLSLASIESAPASTTCARNGKSIWDWNKKASVVLLMDTFAASLYSLMLMYAK